MEVFGLPFAVRKKLPMKRAVLYLRVSTTNQTTANQERELREIAERAGWEVVKVYKDHGISGAKGRDKRPAFDALCRDASGARTSHFDAQGFESYQLKCKFCRSSLAGVIDPFDGELLLSVMPQNGSSD
jgi:hypothetical protein